MTTSIAWSDETWNWLAGCSRKSPGCKGCYAEVAAKSPRLQQFPQYQKVAKWDGTVEFVESQLLKPLKWRSPKKIFTCSMSDVFHENVQDLWRDRAFAIMALCPQHNFQILTKRPEIMLSYLSNPETTHRIEEIVYEFSLNGLNSWPLPNVWLGVSVENQKTVDERIPLLLQTPAAIRFLSCEPLLEKVDLGFGKSCNYCGGSGQHCDVCSYTGWDVEPYLLSEEFDHINFEKYRPNWVIAGGESGSKARPCHVEWIRSLVRQCQDAEVPVFVKQLGSNAIASSPYIEGIAETHHQIKFRDRKASDISEWPEDLRIQQFPN